MRTATLAVITVFLISGSICSICIISDLAEMSESEEDAIPDIHRGKSPDTIYPSSREDDAPRYRDEAVMLAYYGRAGGLDLMEHAHEFSVKQGAAISPGNGSVFDSQVSSFVADDVDVIMVNSGNDFSNATARAIEEAVRVNGKILCADYPADERFNDSLPGEAVDLGTYGPRLVLRAPGHPVARGLPDTFQNVQSEQLVRRNVFKKIDATVILDYLNDDSPALLIRPYGTGYVIQHTFGRSRAFYGAEEDTVYYNAIMWALGEIRNAYSPGFPVNVSAGGGDGEVCLSWETPHDTGNIPISGYNIYCGESIFNITYLDSTTEPAYIHGDVTNGQRYYYRIAPVNFKGENANAPYVNATPLGMPSVPLDLRLRAGDGFIEASWEKPLMNGGGPLVGYSLYRGPNATSLYQYGNVTGGATSFNDTNVENGRTYHYQITARNAIWEGVPTDPLHAIPSGLPGRPINVTCEAEDSTVVVRWMPPQDDGGAALTGYMLYRGNGSTSLGFPRFVWNRLNFTDLYGLVNGNTYHYAVSAVNSNGEGPLSELNSSIPVTVPGEPENLTAVEGDGLVKLRWNPPWDNGGAELIHFLLYRNSGDDDLTVIEVSANCTLHTDKDLVNGRNYLYRISAVNRVGEGPRAGVLNITPFAPPGEPRNLTVEQEGDGARLDWDRPEHDGGSEVTKYRLYRSEPGVEGSIIATVPKGSTYLDATIPAPGTYGYYAVAVTGVGESPPTITVEIVISWKPSEPLTFRVVADGGTAVLKWGIPERNGGLAIEGYYVYRRAGDGDLQRIEWVEGIEYVDEDVVPALEYVYSISAVNARGEGPRTDEKALALTVPERKEGEKSSLADTVRKPWFIASVAVLLLIIVIMLILIFRSRKKVEVKEWSGGQPLSGQSSMRGTSGSSSKGISSGNTAARKSPRGIGSSSRGTGGRTPAHRRGAGSGSWIDAGFSRAGTSSPAGTGSVYGAGTHEAPAYEEEISFFSRTEKGNSMRSADGARSEAEGGNQPNWGPSLDVGSSVEPKTQEDGALPGTTVRSEGGTTVPPESASGQDPPSPPDERLEAAGAGDGGTDPSPYTRREGHIILPEAGDAGYRNILEKIVERTKGRKGRAAPRIVMPEDVGRQVTQPKGGGKRKEEACGICLGPMVGGSGRIECKCGREYHLSCAETVGECPACDNDMREKISTSLARCKGKEELSFIWGKK